MMSYAGIPLSEPPGTDIGAWIAGNIQPHQLFPLAYRSWPGTFTNGPILNNTPDEPRAVVINSLFWPQGASRFARGHFVVTSSQLDSIRRVVYRSGAQESGTLVFSDGEQSINPLMWMLPPIPLAKSLP